jgi:hydroxymethylbilane synthase
MRIGTRGSALALAQANWVAARLDGAEVVVLRTSGDDGRAAGDKSRWVDTIEAALVDGEIDLAVHSAKDVPGVLADGTVIAAVPEREDPRDVMVGSGRRVGTSSLRRRAQLLAADPDREVVDLRGNVDTRLRKRAAGEVDVLVLAAAGLDRLDRRREGGGTLNGGVFVPAPGQGVIAVQARQSSPAADVAAGASHARTFACLLAERAAVRELDASCHTPVGIHADGARIRGFAGLPDGSAWLVDEVPVGGGREAEEARLVAAARALAARMLAAGAADLLRDAEAMAAR